MGATRASRAWDDARVRAVRAGAHARKRLPEVRAELVVHAVVPRPLPEASLYSPVAPTVLRPNDPAHTPCTICAARLAVARLACKGRLQHFERVSRQSVVVPSASGQRKTRLALRGQTRMQAKGGYSSSRS
jgi:hypothetical protein